MRLEQWSPYMRGFVGAVIGAVVTLFVWHLWQDHVAFHQLLTFVTANAAKLQKLP